MTAPTAGDNARNAATFGRDAAAYAAGRPRYPDALFDWLAAQAPARHAAWDAGCGTGQATAALAQRFTRVIATDVSPEQIAQAPRLANVTWQVGRAEDVTHAPRSLDLVLVAQALHWFDLDRFYALARDALVPGGVIAAVGYGFFFIEPALDETIRRELLDPIRPFWAQGNATLLKGYAHLPFPFDEIAAPEMAIELDWTLAQLLAYVDTWSAVRRIRSEHGVDPVERAAHALAPLWGDGARRVTMPMTLRVGRTDAA